MNFWGKIVGSAAGLAIGGAIGGVIGAVAGHAYDRFRSEELLRMRRSRGKLSRVLPQGRAGRIAAPARDHHQSAAATALIILGAKLAKADGVVSREEIRSFRARFRISEQLVGGVGHIYNQAKNTSAGFEPYARQLAAFHNNSQTALEEIIVGLFEVALADGELHPNELQYLREVATLFEIEPSRFAEIRQTFLQISGVKDPTEDAYRLLGVQRETADAEIKKAYRDLVRELHPDRLTARKFSPHIIDQATMCLAAINGAYDKIAKERGLR